MQNLPRQGKDGLSAHAWSTLHHFHMIHTMLTGLLDKITTCQPNVVELWEILCGRNSVPYRASYF